MLCFVICLYISYNFSGIGTVQKLEQTLARRMLPINKTKTQIKKLEKFRFIKNLSEKHFCFVFDIYFYSLLNFNKQSIFYFKLY